MVFKLGTAITDFFGSFTKKQSKNVDEIAEGISSKTDNLVPSKTPTASPVKAVDEIAGGESKIYSGSPAVLPAKTSVFSSKTAKLGLFGGGAIIGGAIGTSLLATSGAIDPYTPDPVIEENTDPEKGGNTYIYNTGNEAVDEGLNWLQTQIDEIVTFLSDLFTPSSGEQIGGEFGDIGAITETGTPVSIAKIGLGIAAVIAVIAAVVFVSKRRGKKGRRKK